MNRQGLATVFAAVFLLIAFPLSTLQAPGSVTAGLSAGVVMPLDDTFHMIFFVLVGLCAIRLGMDTMVSLPMLVLIMLYLGGMAASGSVWSPYCKVAVWMAVLSFALISGTLKPVMPLLAGILIAALAYLIGIDYTQLKPAIASRGFVFVGAMLSGSLLMATGASLGIALFGVPEAEKLGRKWEGLLSRLHLRKPVAHQEER